jgi:hypothetical protein
MTAGLCLRSSQGDIASSCSRSGARDLPGAANHSPPAQKSRSRVGFHDWGALDADCHEFVASQPTIGDLALIGAADE